MESNSHLEKINQLRNLIKFEAANEGYNLKSLYAKMNKLYGRKPDVSNYSSKIRRGALTILELYEICSILNIEISFNKFKN